MLKEGNLEYNAKRKEVEDYQNAEYEKHLQRASAKEQRIRWRKMLVNENMENTDINMMKSETSTPQQSTLLNFQMLIYVC